MRRARARASLAHASQRERATVRLGVYFLPDQPLHVIQRGNDRGAIFFAADDYARYRRWLAEAVAAYGCLIHAYALMTNHMHLLVTLRRGDSLPRTMQSLGRRLRVPCQRRLPAERHALGGPLSRGTNRQRGLLPRCCRYIELNLVRAGLVRQPWHQNRPRKIGVRLRLALPQAGGGCRRGLPTGRYSCLIGGQVL